MTDKLREAAQMALDALENAYDAINSWGGYASAYFQKKHDLEADVSDCRDAIEALRAALAQPQREWQGLTAGETKILRRVATNDREFADLISAKLKEKNNG